MNKQRLALWFAPRFYWALGAIAALLACAPGVPLFIPAGVAASVVLCALLIADFARGPRANDIAVTRRIPDHIALRTPAIIAYDVSNRSRIDIRFYAVDAAVRTLTFDAPASPARIPAERRMTIERVATPVSRGIDAFTAIYAWYENDIGLLRRRAFVDVAQEFRVYPDLSAVRRYGSLHVRNRLIEAGIRRMRMRGGGTEFESLREFSNGDAFRAIDWKATARRGKLMVAQHEIERSQDVMLALDCGRLMTARVGDQRKLDFAVTAALSLASIASLAHDRVGVAAFAATMLAARAPRSTAASIHALTKSISDIEPRFEESDYALAASYLRAHLHRRSLVVLFTDAIDPIAQSTVLAEFASLAKRHHVLCVFMNDAAVENALSVPPTTIDDAYGTTVAIELSHERAQAKRTLGRLGIDVLDVPAPKLATATIEEYLRMKSRGAF